MIINNRAPSYFNALFSRVNEQHCYKTRQSLMDITLCRFKGLFDILGHFCGISYLWILKVFPIWLVLVQKLKVGSEVGCFVDEFVLRTWLCVIVHFCKYGFYCNFCIYNAVPVHLLPGVEFVLYIKDHNGNKFDFKLCVILDELSVFTTFFLK